MVRQQFSCNDHLKFSAASEQIVSSLLCCPVHLADKMSSFSNLVLLLFSFKNWFDNWPEQSSEWTSFNFLGQHTIFFMLSFLCNQKFDLRFLDLIQNQSGNQMPTAQDQNHSELKRWLNSVKTPLKNQIRSNDNELNRVEKKCSSSYLEALQICWIT